MHAVVDGEMDPERAAASLAQFVDASEPLAKSLGAAAFLHVPQAADDAPQSAAALIRLAGDAALDAASALAAESLAAPSDAPALAKRLSVCWSVFNTAKAFDRARVLLLDVARSVPHASLLTALDAAAATCPPALQSDGASRALRAIQLFVDDDALAVRCGWAATPSAERDAAVDALAGEAYDVLAASVSESAGMHALDETPGEIDALQCIALIMATKGFSWAYSFLDRAWANIRPDASPRSLVLHVRLIESAVRVQPPAELKGHWDHLEQRLRATVDETCTIELMFYT